MVASLLASALCALYAITANRVAMPQVTQLRGWWKQHSSAPKAGYASPRIAESLLNSSHLDGRSPASDAKSDADSRAKWFTFSASLTLLAVVSLGFLVVSVLIQVWGDSL